MKKKRRDTIMNEMLKQVVTFLQENVLMANVLSGTTVNWFCWHCD